MAVMLFATLLLVGLVAAFLRDRLDSGSAQRAALRDAMVRGDMKPEDYARALQTV